MTHANAGAKSKTLSQPFFGVVLVLLFIGAGGLFGLRYLKPTPAPPIEVPREALTLREGGLYWRAEKSPFTGVVLEKYPNGKIKSRSAVSNGLLNGLSKGWYTNGVLQVQESFVNGISHGLREKWYDSGKPMSSVQIQGGKLEGLFRRWHENGTLAEEIPMKAGEGDGVARSFYSSGFLKSEAHLEKGKVLNQKSWEDGQRKNTNG